MIATASLINPYPNTIENIFGFLSPRIVKAANESVALIVAAYSNIFTGERCIIYLGPE